MAERLAAVYGDRVRVDEDGWTVTHGEAVALVDRWSATLAACIGPPGDRVVLATPNGHRQLLATLAVRRAAGGGAGERGRGPSRWNAWVADAGAPVVVRDVAELEPSWAARSGQPAVAVNPDDLAALGTPRARPVTRRACG